MMITALCWVMLCVYWMIMAIGNKKTVRRQSSVKRSFVSGLIVLGYALVYVPGLSASWLGVRFLPSAQGIACVGVVTCVLGVAFAAWARHTLGGNWSAIVTIKEDHELIVTGPYRSVRHPIYTGLLLGILGSGITLGEIRGLAAFFVVLAAFAVKMQEEERFMRTQFPDAYPDYEKRVRKLIPFVF
jgi:protein-S-isoprenylcysteine O-methyltransferase Ste14